MNKEQRVKRLRNVGGSASLAPKGAPRRPPPGGAHGSPTGGSATAGGGDSRSQDVATNSESSALVEGPLARLDGYDWYGEYVELTQGYAWRVAAYIAWAASPAVGRKPATQLELAQALGLKTDRTIRQWKEKEPGIEAEIKRVQAGPLLRHRRDLYEALVKAGVGGDVPALKLALEMSGDYTPRLKQTLDANVKTVPFTADELGQAEAELKAFEASRPEGPRAGGLPGANGVGG